VKPAQSSTQLNPLGVVAPPPIEVECEAFTGSLAALYEIVRAHKLSLLDVPMRPICEAYLLYLMDLKEQDLDSAAAAMVALCYLIEQKADAIIPQVEPEADWEDAPEIDFAEPYIREFDQAIEALSVFEEAREKIFFRGGEVGDLYELPFQIGAVTSADLSMAFERLLKRAAPEPPEILQKTRRSLATQMELVLGILREEFQSLTELVPQPFTRTEAVWWFLSLLELIKLKKAIVRLGDDDVLFARASD